MVLNRSEMKRKRRQQCPSPILHDGPKRTKVHAQRKFAQGSNLNSPVITPVKELEKQEIDILPEPVELLPIKRPNTEDFLTFLCFRGTPLLPPNLNFFNTASIVDTNGQVHEIKSESPKNGPIDTSAITKTGSGSADRPFIAFGVRKRADPIVISRQMDKKRRHALALQALRRKYQEQRMAEIRAVTISKLSEKTISRTIVRSSSVLKPDAISKKSNPVPKSKTVETAKDDKMTTRSIKAGLRPQIKQKMCLRSFRGRFVQKELQFRNIKKKALPEKTFVKKKIKKHENEGNKGVKSDYSSGDEKPLPKSEKKPPPNSVTPKIAKKTAVETKKPVEVNFRITRSNKSLITKIAARRQKLKQRMLMSTPKTIIKPRTLRSHTAQKARLITEKKQKVFIKNKKDTENEREVRKEVLPPVKKQIKTNSVSNISNAVKEQKSVLCTKKEQKTTENSAKEPKVVPVTKKIVKGTEQLKKNTPPAPIIKNKNEKTPSAKKEQENTKKAKQTPDNKNDISTTEEAKNELSSKKKAPIIIKKNTPRSVEKKDVEKNSSKQVEDDVKKVETLKTNRDEKDNCELRTSQRPTRKTKEAAAIYMEILSHKLVNESRIDDDNVSIDSFPELPNVKKTEQRENELKAKARSTKTSESEGDNKKTIKKEKEKDAENKTTKCGDKKKVGLKPNEKTEEDKKAKNTNSLKDDVSNEEVIKEIISEVKKNIAKADVKDEVCDRQTRSTNIAKNLEKSQTCPIEQIKDIELKIHINPIDVVKGNKKVKEDKEPQIKKNVKSNDTAVESDGSDENIKKKTGNAMSVKTNTEGVKRQTRNSSQNNKHVRSDDSDESFRVDIRIPRKKQITRSKVKTQDSDNAETQKSAKKSPRDYIRSYKECSSSDSDVFSAVEVDVKEITHKNKKFTKTKRQQKDEVSFSDSDEEPLSKLAGSKDVASVTKEKVPEKKETKQKTVENEEKESFVKPKRECAKRPQNYLPMLSSSDEDDSYFHGFKVKIENKPRVTKLPETSCPYVPDLSCKDVGRRFGKGKVNMSTEQIEKWLKESAMAGNSVKNENDAMQFGEKIPTDTSHSVADSIDTEKLKMLLISNVDKSGTETKKSSSKLDAEQTPKSKQSSTTKSVIADRKLIFRNKTKEIGVNVKAFSASNENSVYAFGEEAEDVMKTPFRRPTRRPSSTTTSKSEDESSKFEDLPKVAQFRKPAFVKQEAKLEVTEENAFYVPSQPSSKPKVPMGTKIDKKSLASTSMGVSSANQKHPLKVPSRSLDVSDDSKYKVPSSPSASSSSSAKLYKRQTSKCRSSDILPVKLPDFPLGGACGQLVEAPSFYPTEREFQDPLEYIEKIRPKSEQFGICRIVPPATFKPECKVTDDMRFTAYNQYVHKMLHRWGPNFKELMAIKKYLSTQNIGLTHSPWIGGMEIDLPRLYQTVQSLGGLKEVIEKKKWSKVSDAMKIPKLAQDRVTKLDDIYCKYLLPYDTLSPGEREKLLDEVETEWAKRESKSLLKAQLNIDDSPEVESGSDDEAEECIVKGRSMALNAFYRIARNTMSMWFKNQEPPAEEVEHEFWKHVTMKQNHICVHSGSIDSGNWGYGFAVSKNSPFARHAWNLKVLTNNSGSVLRSLGPVMGVTVPTLHVGMVFSSCCWYRDPHSLPWIEYLHTGGKKIWYGIPDSTSSTFHAALKTMVPNYCRNKSLWLPSDTVMVPPNLLVEHGVSLCRIVQEPGQFIIVFPKVFTSSLSTGYVVSESVYFAPSYWLKTARTVFDELKNSCESSVFSFDRLLLSIVNDARSNVEVLKLIIPAVQELCDKEKIAREKIKSLGVSLTEKLPLPEASLVRKKKKLHNEDGEYECDICRTTLFVSMVFESQEDAVYCLDHAAEHIEKKKIQSKHCKLSYTYEEKELDTLVEKIKSAITNKLQKKVLGKFAGLPTLLK